jgi:uncharacterized membrane protein YcaP (DUF421 family)
MLDIVIYIINGFIGALMYFLTLVVKGIKRLGNIGDGQTVALLMLGAILGYVYYNAVIRLSLPDSFVAIWVGYANIGIVDTLYSLVKKLLLGGQNAGGNT